MGLAVVYGIIKSHRGFIDVESKRARGTTFMLYFPIQPRGIESLKVPKEKLEEFAGGNETILFVEDEDMLVDLLKSLLEERGYLVLTAKDGEEAVDMYKRYKDTIALVLADIGLPKLSGHEVFQKIREINPMAKVILASGYLEPHLKSEILKAGAKAFVQKPYVPNEVLKRIREVIDKSTPA